MEKPAVLLNSKLSPDLLPTDEIACTTCPIAIWFSTPTEMNCYCSRMYLIVWNSTKTANRITDCSAKAQAEAEALVATAG